MLFTCSKGRGYKILSWKKYCTVMTDNNIHLSQSCFRGKMLFPTISSKKNQACCRAPSLTLPLLTTHWRANSSWKSLSTDEEIQRQKKWEG